MYNLQNTFLNEQLGDDNFVTVSPSSSRFPTGSSLQFHENASYFYSNDKLTLFDTYEGFECKIIPFQKVNDGQFQINIITNNLVDIASMFVELTGSLQVHDPLRLRPNNKYVGQFINEETKIGQMQPSINTIEPEQKINMRMNMYNDNDKLFFPVFWKKSIVKNFRTRMGNNDQALENWAQSTQNALNLLVTPTNRDRQIFGGMNNVSGFQTIPELFIREKNVLDELSRGKLKKEGSPDRYVPYKLRIPLRYLSTVFNVSRDNQFWPTGLPLQLNLDVYDKITLFSSGMVYTYGPSQPQGEPIQAPFDTKNSQLIVFELQNITDIKLCYNEHVLKLAVKEAINTKLLNESMVYHYSIPQLYSVPSDGGEFNFFISLNTATVTELIIYSTYIDDSSIDLKYSKFEECFNGTQIAFVEKDPEYTPYAQAQINEHVFKNGPGSIIIQSLQINCPMTGKNLMLYEGTFIEAKDSLQERIHGTEFSCKQERDVRNRYAGVNNYFRLVITPQKSHTPLRTSVSSDKRQVNLKILAFSKRSDWWNSSTIYQLPSDQQLNVLIPSLRQYEVDVVRNVNTNTYPSFKTDRNYVHKNINEIMDY